MAIAKPVRTKAQRKAGLSISEARAANTGKTGDQIRSEGAASERATAQMRESAEKTDVGTVSALNEARRQAIESGADPYAGNLKNYNTFASTFSGGAPSSTGSTSAPSGTSFQYVDTAGKVQTVYAASEEEARSLASNIAPTSGLRMVAPAYTPQKTNGITSSSGNARQEEARLGSIISQLSAPAYSTPAKTTKYIDEYDRSLQNLITASERDINATYDEERATTEEKQAGEVGSTSAALARMGGYLGGSASGTGALLKLSASHRAEVASLESKRMAALTEARTNFAEKRFQAAKQKAEEAKWWEEEIYARQQDFFDNQRALLADERTERNQERDDARSVITNIISNTSGQDWDELSEDTQKALEQNAIRAGYPLDVIKNMMAMPKAEAARIDQLLKDAAKKGAPASILSAISSADGFAEAAAIAAPYIATGGGGSGDGQLVSIPEYDQFVVEYLSTPAGQAAKEQIEAAAMTNFTPEQLIIEMKNSPSVRSIYDSTVAKVQASSGGSTPFTATEKKKLEQAGLLNATRQQQLDHLYGKGDSTGSRVDSIVE